MKKIKSITVIGKRWFDRANGNTYHSVNVLVNGASVAFVPFTYGYGEQYVETAAQKLEELGLIKREKMPHTYQPLWRHCEDNKIEFTQNVADVSRKKDL